MHIENNVKLFNTACSIVSAMKQRGLSNEDLFVLVDHMRTVASAEFPKPEEKSPIIVPSTEQVAEVVEAK